LFAKITVQKYRTLPKVVDLKQYLLYLHFWSCCWEITDKRTLSKRRFTFVVKKVIFPFEHLIKTSSNDFAKMLSFPFFPLLWHHNAQMTTSDRTFSKVQKNHMVFKEARNKHQQLLWSNICVLFVYLYFIFC